MKQFGMLILCGVLVLCQSCATQVLWKATNPNERIWIDADKTTEDALKSRGVVYEVYESDTAKGYLINKSGWKRMRDYHLRVLGTPVTLVLDAATTVVVVGAYMFVSDPYGTCSLIVDLCD